MPTNDKSIAARSAAIAHIRNSWTARFVLKLTITRAINSGANAQSQQLSTVLIFTCSARSVADFIRESSDGGAMVVRSLSSADLRYLLLAQAAHLDFESFPAAFH